MPEEKLPLQPDAQAEANAAVQVLQNILKAENIDSSSPEELLSWYNEKKQLSDTAAKRRKMRKMILIAVCVLAIALGLFLAHTLWPRPVELDEDAPQCIDITVQSDGFLVTMEDDGSGIDYAEIIVLQDDTEVQPIKTDKKKGTIFLPPLPETVQSMTLIVPDKAGNRKILTFRNAEE